MPWRALALALRALADAILWHTASEEPTEHTDHYAAHALEASYAQSAEHGAEHVAMSLAGAWHAAGTLIAAVALVLIITAATLRLAVALALALYRCADACEMRTA